MIVTTSRPRIANGAANPGMVDFGDKGVFAVAAVGTDSAIVEPVSSDAGAVM